MAKLTPEQQSKLNELTALRDAPDDDDVIVEICHGEKSAKLPYHKAKGWLDDTFGLESASKTDEDLAKISGRTQRIRKDTDGETSKDRVSQRYFGKRDNPDEAS